MLKNLFSMFLFVLLCSQSVYASISVKELPTAKEFYFLDYDQILVVPNDEADNIYKYEWSTSRNVKIGEVVTTKKIQALLKKEFSPFKNMISLYREDQRQLSKIVAYSIAQHKREEKATLKEVLDLFYNNYCNMENTEALSHDDIVYFIEESKRHRSYILKHFTSLFPDSISKNNFKPFEFDVN